VPVVTPVPVVVPAPVAPIPVVPAPVAPVRVPVVVPGAVLPTVVVPRIDGLSDGYRPIRSLAVVALVSSAAPPSGVGASRPARELSLL
jgi:hypothetical protein